MPARSLRILVRGLPKRVGVDVQGLRVRRIRGFRSVGRAGRLVGDRSVVAIRVNCCQLPHRAPVRFVRRIQLKKVRLANQMLANGAFLGNVSNDIPNYRL